MDDTRPFPLTEKEADTLLWALGAALNEFEVSGDGNAWDDHYALQDRLTALWPDAAEGGP